MVLRFDGVLQVEDLLTEREVVGDEARAVIFELADADGLRRVDSERFVSFARAMSRCWWLDILCQFAVLSHEFPLDGLERFSRGCGGRGRRRRRHGGLI